MSTTALRRAGALLLACALSTTAIPAAAAPAGEAAEGPFLLQTLQSWLAAWLPGAVADSTKPPAWKAVGAEGDRTGSSASTEESPVAEPELGPEANPDG